MRKGRASAGAGTLEEYTIAEIPASERHARPRDLFIFTIWLSSNIMPLTFLTAARPRAPFWGKAQVISLLGEVLAMAQGARDGQAPPAELMTVPCRSPGSWPRQSRTTECCGA